ncbi:MAG TPA: UDP-N-acetyl-D-mannosamine dehydrogenase [Cytophagales bacterium]|nr:UDP-N-acetyl-D-mannosamine dehydrogenase [Cytophagales bacterium]HAP61433.1 UDP-N-acetyl-D-mannosamine dehydrogenase [Cytophagales bacterium]
MVGLGYIGLPTAALMASRGLQVTGVDIQQSVVDTINKGKIHIVEPDLSGLVHHVVSQGTLVANTQPVSAGTYLIAVPTPFKGEHQPDIRYVESATRSVIPHLKPGDLFIIESTSPVGTTEKMQALIEGERPELKDELYIAYCPERVLPGNVIYELEHNDRVIGGVNATSTAKALEFYARFVKGELHATNAKTAEMCKLVENSYRDVNIAFANELSLICDEAGINPWELIALANKHPRVNILQPGTGVGGHCIAVDPWFIVSDFPQQANIIRQAREINNYKTLWVIEKIKNEALQFEQKHGRVPVVAALGLAFKPNIDDLRESPALEVARALKSEGMNLLVVEPHVPSHAEFELRELEDVRENADILVVLVAHNAFRQYNWPAQEDKRVLDFCGAIKPN